MALEEHEVVGLDLSRASMSRVYDYWLGGDSNFAVDREVAEQIAQAVPQIPAGARANRCFLGRVVRWCLGIGIDQFLDLGSGIPTVGNVHEVAQGINPHARVAYVDNEAVAVGHSRTLLEGNPRASITFADLRDPEAVLSADTVTGLLDFDRPIAVLMLTVLHYIRDTDEAAGIVRGYRQKLVPGSALAISHAAADDPGVDVAAAAQLTQRTTNPGYPRTRDEIAVLLGDAPLVEPGIVFAQDWRPDEQAEKLTGHSGLYAAAARLTN